MHIRLEIPLAVSRLSAPERNDMENHNKYITGNTIFITGGAGFIGSHLCEKLVEDNKVVVYDSGHRDAISKTGLLKHPNLKFIEGDILDFEKVKTGMRGCNAVIHCAAIAGIDTVVKKPIMTMRVNLFGTHNVIEAAVSNKVKKFIGFSTSEVYGPYIYKGSEDSLTTQGEVGKTRWTYAVSKLAAEHLIHCYKNEHGIDIVSIRPFNVYGPRQVGEGAVHKFIINALKGEDIIIYGDGTQIRAWCYIDDFIDGALRCIIKKEANGKVFNIGNPQSTVTILKLAEKIISLTQSNSKIHFKESPGADVEVRVPSIKKAQTILGFEPKTGLDEGLNKTIEWYRKTV